MTKNTKSKKRAKQRTGKPARDKKWADRAQVRLAKAKNAAPAVRKKLVASLKKEAASRGYAVSTVEKWASFHKSTKAAWPHAVTAKPDPVKVERANQVGKMTRDLISALEEADANKVEAAVRAILEAKLTKDESHQLSYRVGNKANRSDSGVVALRKALEPARAFLNVAKGNAAIGGRIAS